MSDSIAFDRAADTYDQTRAHSPEVMREIVRVLSTELRGRARCLEIGVGTGRIALPLHEAGIAMAGVDLSAPMLARLVAKADGRAPFPLTIGDATRLPFPDASAGAALAVHVLHLVPRWRDVLAEVARVVAPGGVFVLDVAGGWQKRTEADVGMRFAELAGVARRHMGLDHSETREVDEAMGALGASVRLLEPIPERIVRTVAQDIADFERGTWAWTWQIPPEKRARAAAEARAWAAEHLGDLDAPREMLREVRFRVYDLP